MRLLHKVSLLCLCFGALLHPAPARALDYEDYPIVKLRTLDKITARTMTFEAKVGATMKFGEIFIKVQTCRKPPPVQKTEAAAFLQIWQTDALKNTSNWIFSGWMFASSPSLSGMDHPVYDVWVIDCLGKDPEEIPPEATDSEDGVITPGADEPELPPAEELGQEQIGPGTQTPEPGLDDSAAPIDSEAAGTDEPVPASNLPQDAEALPGQDAAPLPGDTAPVPQPQPQPEPEPTLEPQPDTGAQDPAYQGIY